MAKECTLLKSHLGCYATLERVVAQRTLENCFRLSYTYVAIFSLVELPTHITLIGLQ